MGGMTQAAIGDEMRIRHAVLQSLLVILVCSCSAHPSEPVSGGGAPVTTMVPMDAIVITDTGSTNMIGYRIVIGRNGEASYTSGDSHGSTQLPEPIFSKLKYDVVMAQPLSHVRASPNCMKPASFGDSTFIALGGERSEDLSCTASTKGKTLKDDVEAVTLFLHVRDAPRAQGHPLPPQNY
jgi:hypothetical protein